MSDRREQFRAVFLAAIMVISMVGVGFAGFAGTAVAQDDPATAENATVSANPADFDADAHTNESVHAITLTVDDELAGTDPEGQDLVIDYSDDFGIEAGVVAAEADITLELIRDGEVETADEDLTTDDDSVATQEGENNVTITLTNTDVAGDELLEGDVIRLVIDDPTVSAAGEFQNPSEGEDTEVRVDAAD